MATRRRTLLLTCALGFCAAVLPSTLAGATPGQDPGPTFGGAGQVTSTTAVAEAPTSTTEATSTQDSQTLVESVDPPEQRLFTESRKVAAVIAGLVFVALALLLLTIRYWRVTRPVDAEADTGDDQASGGTDHDAADDDWEPRTGEHQRVEIPSGFTPARPGVAARRKALGLTKPA